MAATNPGTGGRGLLASKWDNHDTFTIEEAGEILRLSRGSAYTAAAVGEIHAIRIGRRLVVPRRAIEKMLLAE